MSDVEELRAHLQRFARSIATPSADTILAEALDLAAEIVDARIKGLTLYGTEAMRIPAPSNGQIVGFYEPPLSPKKLSIASAMVSVKSLLEAESTVLAKVA